MSVAATTVAVRSPPAASRELAGELARSDARNASTVDEHVGVAFDHVSDEELLRRHAQRLAEEGWTNVEWFETNKADIEELRATGWIDHAISGSAPPHEVATTLLRVHSAPGFPSP
jgi:hypothetical protein